MPTLNKQMLTLADDVIEPSFRKIFGEQFSRFDSQEPPAICFGVPIADDFPAVLFIEPFGSDGAMLSAHLVIGCEIQDAEAAETWARRKSACLRFGHIQFLLTEGIVEFHYGTFSEGVNEATLRQILALLAAQTHEYGSLAEATGALSVGAVHAVDALTDTD